MRVKPLKAVHPSTIQLIEDWGGIRNVPFLNCHECNKKISLAKSTYVVARYETNYHLCESCTNKAKKQ